MGSNVYDLDVRIEHIRETIPFRECFTGCVHETLINPFNLRNKCPRLHLIALDEHYVEFNEWPCCRGESMEKGHARLASRRSRYGVGVRAHVLDVGVGRVGPVDCSLSRRQKDRCRHRHSTKWLTGTSVFLNDTQCRIPSCQRGTIRSRMMIHSCLLDGIAVLLR